ncbi:MAG: YbaK/EbsC family protein [Acidimicrobiia bacterium]|nr:MAG: YbaK/EbsC family protein [Acidimicrobiia bacterium]
MTDAPAQKDTRLDGVIYEVARHRRVTSIDEAAALRGVDVSKMIKTMVVRRGHDDYLFVLVPGDRVIDWPKLRSHLGARRLSMPDAEEALAVTGYEHGTITPFGASRTLPVLADIRVASGTVSIGAGAPGVSLRIDGGAVVAAVAADTADVTRPSG